MSDRLAIDGGTPVRTAPLPPSWLGAYEMGVEEEEAVLKVLREKRVFRYIAKEESETARLEKAVAEFTGRDYALAVNSGTAALICALVGLDIGPGDEVIVPGYTYIATAAAVVTVGAVPVIAEVDNSLTLDPEDLERKITGLTKAVIPVHMRGTPCRMDEICAIAKKHGIKVIEDTAQANGGNYKGKTLGGIGDVGCYSYQMSKTITAGEGGMVVTGDRLVFERILMAHDSAFGFWKPDETAIRPIPGEGFRISEVSGAIALVQMGRLRGIVERLHNAKYRIVNQIRGLAGITLQDVPDESGDASVCLMFFAPDAEIANTYAKALNAEGIPCGTMFSKEIPDRHIYPNWTYVLEKRGRSSNWSPWHPSVYKGSVEYSKDMCPKTLDYLGRTIHIGLSPRLTAADSDDIARAIRKVVTALAR
ncbi:MAG TPA: aminotransferase class I/II-fold pyridoxal phosphate-dependent enzyme [Candidatus Latescibacteria bacterium]|nr:aminotransferase class I/II-fold pyridoxal phosphate-dependent enzyme [Candidatus Latescibacterota bacterium]